MFSSLYLNSANLNLSVLNSCGIAIANVCHLLTSPLINTGAKFQSSPSFFEKAKKSISEPISVLPFTFKKRHASLLPNDDKSILFLITATWNLLLL